MWKEGFGSPKNFGVAPYDRPLVGASEGTPGDAKCVTEILGAGGGKSKEVGDKV